MIKYFKIICIATFSFIFIGCNHSYSIGGDSYFRNKKRIPLENSHYLHKEVHSTNQTNNIQHQKIHKKEFNINTRSDYRSEYSNMPEPQPIYLKHDDEEHKNYHYHAKKNQSILYNNNDTPTAGYHADTKVINIKPKKIKVTHTKSKNKSQTEKATTLDEMPSTNLTNKDKEKIVESKNSEVKNLVHKARKLKPILNKQNTITLSNKKQNNNTKGISPSDINKNLKNEKLDKSKEIDQKLQQLLDEYDNSQNTDIKIKKIQNKKNNQIKNTTKTKHHNQEIDTSDNENKPIPLPFE